MTQSPASSFPASPPLRLLFAALSDVGRVRKDNQDSGYAGPWLLTVCDGVGGAARGDIASGTAVQQLRKLDQKPTEEDLLALVAGALHRAHDRIGELVDEDPTLSGTSTTATVALFDGTRVAIGHVGDSRAYLLRAGTLTQLTKDHTFVQSLIDEGRITEEESRMHPHRNLILKAVDGVHEAEPDLFQLYLAPGDRLFLCSDGACGVLDDKRIHDILTTGTADYAVVEMVRASLEAGSSDNITCVVADVLEADGSPAETPLLVGAAAELPRRRTGVATRFRGHRSGDTGELEPVAEEIPEGVPNAIPNDPIDPELVRYAPLAPRRFVWVKRFAAAAVVLGLVWMAMTAAYAWSQRQFFVGEHEGTVTIYRGLDASLPGISLNEAYRQSDIELSQLRRTDRDTIRDGLEAEDLDDAERIVRNLAADAVEPCPTTEPTGPTDETAADC